AAGTWLPVQSELFPLVPVALRRALRIVRRYGSFYGLHSITRNSKPAEMPKNIPLLHPSVQRRCGLDEGFQSLLSQIVFPKTRTLKKPMKWTCATHWLAGLALILLFPEGASNRVPRENC